MPIYEYECTSCCNVFEIIQRMTEDPLTACPDCSGPVRKLVSMSSFQLKGGGWYADGYAGKSANGSGAKPAAGSTESSPAKCDTSSADSSASPTESKKASTTAAS